MQFWMVHQREHLTIPFKRYRIFAIYINMFFKYTIWEKKKISEVSFYFKSIDVKQMIVLQKRALFQVQEYKFTCVRS